MTKHASDEQLRMFRQFVLIRPNLSYVRNIEVLYFESPVQIEITGESSAQGCTFRKITFFQNYV